MIHFRKGKKVLCGTTITGSWFKETTTSKAKTTCTRCLVSLDVRARKVVEKGDKRKLKALEKECTALWRHVVWLTWGGKCALCGNACNDHNSHHYFTKGTHSAHRYNPYCGILLDYGCHIGKVHRGGEIEQLRDIYVTKIGTTLFEQLKRESYEVTKYPMDVLLNVKKSLSECVTVLEWADKADAAAINEEIARR